MLLCTSGPSHAHQVQFEDVPGTGNLSQHAGTGRTRCDAGMLRASQEVACHTPWHLCPPCWPQGCRPAGRHTRASGACQTPGAPWRQHGAAGTARLHLFKSSSALESAVAHVPQCKSMLHARGAPRHATAEAMQRLHNMQENKSSAIYSSGHATWRPADQELALMGHCPDQAQPGVCSRRRPAGSGECARESAAPRAQERQLPLCKADRQVLQSHTERLLLMSPR